MRCPGVTGGNGGVGRREDEGVEPGDDGRERLLHRDHAVMVPTPHVAVALELHPARAREVRSGADHGCPAALTAHQVQPLAARKPGQIQAVAERPVHRACPAIVHEHAGEPRRARSRAHEVFTEVPRPDAGRISDERLDARPCHRGDGHPLVERGHQVGLGHRRQLVQHHPAGRQGPVQPPVVARSRPRIRHQGIQTSFLTAGQPSGTLPLSPPQVQGHLRRPGRAELHSPLSHVPADVDAVARRRPMA